MVYHPVKDYDLPNIDVLTLLLESPLTWLKDDDVAHAEATQLDNCITKAQMRTITKRLAHVFRNQFGIGANGPGQDVVVCMSSGQVLLSTILYGVIAAGGVYSAASSAYTPGELARQIKQGPSNLLVVSEDCTEVGVKAAKECGIPLDRVLIVQSMGGRRSLTGVSDKDKDYLKETAELDWERVTDPKILTERAICLLYSSGTTGPPKGVHYSHHNMASAGLLASFVNREYFQRRKAQDPTYNHEYRTLAHLPAAHIAGVQGYCVNSTVAGGSVYWMPKFDFPKFLELNKKLRITFFFSVPPIYLLIAKSPLVTDQFATLEHAISGAAPLGADTKTMAEKRMGCPLSQTWGLSETTGSVTYMPWDQHDATGGISPLLPTTRARLIDEDENDVPEGQEGELAVKGPMVVKGYWRNEKATRDTFTKDGQGWFKTGDVGVYKNGYFYIVDRKKEMIKYKGLQVAPAELEAHLLSHPRILDAAVIGVAAPDGSGNELPRAYVVVEGSGSGAGGKEPPRLSEAEIKQFVKDNLASHKQLRGGVVYLDVIPKSPSGKILRRTLRDAAKKERQESRAKL